MTQSLQRELKLGLRDVVHSGSAVFIIVQFLCFSENSLGMKMVSVNMRRGGRGEKKLQVNQIGQIYFVREQVQ